MVLMKSCTSFSLAFASSLNDGYFSNNLGVILFTALSVVCADKITAVVGVRIFNSVIRLLTGAKVSDSQSGYRAMKSQLLKDLRLNSGTYEIESEMLVKIARRRFRICEVPITFEQRTYGVSSLDPIIDGFKILISIFTSYLKD
jgi:hypothetical protein